MALARAKVTEATETQVITDAQKQDMAEAREAQNVNTTEQNTGPTQEEKDAAQAKQDLLAQRAADEEALKAAASTDASNAAPATDTTASDRASSEAKPEAEVKPDTAAEAQFEAAAEKPKQDLAVKQDSAVATVAEKTKGVMAAFGQEMAAEGFEGMELTGMSFDRLKMHEGKFQLGSEETDMGDTIYVQVMSTREIFVVRQHDGEDSPMYYSYDPAGRTLSDGSSAADTLEKWLDDGYGEGTENPLQIKTYIEGMAMLVKRDDEYASHMVSLSIPPASKSRLAGAFAVGRQRFGVGPGQLVVKCVVGKKVGSGSTAFRPWIFTADSIAQ